MRTGLVSISFRHLSPKEILEWASQAGLQEIEWGGDVHVPLQNLENARAVAQLTAQYGMKTACYGTYLRMTDEEAQTGLQESAVENAVALGAPLIRVWAGRYGSAEAPAEEALAVVRNTRRLAQLAQPHGIHIAFEYHGGTLTDTAVGCKSLLDAVNMPNVGCLWQPPVNMSAEDCVHGIHTVAPYIHNVHVFSWNGHARLPLEQGSQKWHTCLDALAQLPGDRCFLLEFIFEDSFEQLKADAACLTGWLKQHLEVLP